MTPCFFTAQGHIQIYLRNKSYYKKRKMSFLGIFLFTLESEEEELSSAQLEPEKTDLNSVIRGNVPPNPEGNRVDTGGILPPLSNRVLDERCAHHRSWYILNLVLLYSIFLAHLWLKRAPKAELSSAQPEPGVTELSSASGKMSPSPPRRGST